MTTTTDNIANTNTRIGNTTVMRFAPSGSILENMLDFMMDVSPDVLPETEIEDLVQLLGDLEYLEIRQINESRHFTRKSTSIARSRARKWYKKNKGRVKRLQARLKTKAAKKKAEIMSKSDRTSIKKRKKRKYPGTKSHVNEIINRNIEKGSKQIVEKWFEPLHYRVIKSFSINKSITASIYDKIDFLGNDSWVLEIRNGRRFRFKIQQEAIMPYIKLEYLIETEDFL